MSGFRVWFLVLRVWRLLYRIWGLIRKHKMDNGIEYEMDSALVYRI